MKLRGSSSCLDQDLLLPVSMREWLPAEHLSFFVVDAVLGMDLSGFETGKRLDGLGGASYPASSMVAILMYGYTQGILSSRKIERKCFEDVGFRIVGQGVFPDHTTICRFRANHEEAFLSVFSQVLSICWRAGLVNASMIAVDGTKIKAAASIEQSHTIEELAKMLTKAAADVDAEEDAAERKSPPTPPVDPSLGKPGRDRVARIRRALADLNQENTEPEQEQTIQAETDRGNPEPVRAKKTRLKANVVDPDSRVMKVKKGYIQGYNVQVAAVESQVVVGVDVFQNPADTRFLLPMISQVRTNLETITGSDLGHLDVLADAGYYSQTNATIPATTAWIPAGSQFKQQRNIETHATTQERRTQAVARYNQGLITGKQAAIEAGISRNHLYQLVSRQKQRDNQPNPLDIMATRMATPEGKDLYKRRCATIEPVFAQIKHNLGIRQLQRRGLNAAKQELLLIVTAGNLLKAWRTA